MRIVIHDFSGHGFQMQLSREMAARGHSVLHLHFAAFETPKGRVSSQPNDPPTLNIDGLRISRPYNKYSPAKRLWDDWEYASTCLARIQDFKADVVMSANAMPITQNWLRKGCQRLGVPFILWVQDLYGIGLMLNLKRKYGILGQLAALPVIRLEESVIKRSDGVVFISHEFGKQYARQGSEVNSNHHVIENWAPLEELPERPRINPWNLRHGLADKFVFLYTGTLGLKHNPELLVKLAQRFSDSGQVVVAVVTQGLGRTYLEKRKSELGLDNLRLFDFQGFEDLPDVIGSGDVLLAIIEKEAGQFSVPSKVLTYHCAKRPLLLSVPKANLAARIVDGNRTGLVIEPGDLEGFLRAAEALKNDPDYAAGFAERARHYAMRTFQIHAIADRFEIVFRNAHRANHPHAESDRVA
jgi:glycosyltransferase involved in cell wall biosynthesis